MTSHRRLAAALAVVLFLGIWRPDSIEPQTLDLVAQGRQALDADRIDDAVALFERAVTADAKNPAALAWLGSAQVRKGGRVPAIEGAGWVKRGFDTLDEAVERFPDAFVVYVVRGTTAARVPELFRKTEVAVKDLSTAVSMNDARPVVYLNLGLAQKRAGRPAEARAVWEKGKRLYPAAPEAAAIERELRGL